MPYRLMCITAHPDDESGAFGGALLMARAAGVETAVICLTEGRAASNRGEAASGEQLAQMRRAEFDAAGQILGVANGEVLDYPDGDLAAQNFAELIAVLIERIRRFRPQVVLTFGGEGGVNLHRDHTIASLAATAAFHWAGRAHCPVHLTPPRAGVASGSSVEAAQPEPGPTPYWPQKLYYSATPFLLARDPADKAGTCMTPRSLTLELAAHVDQKYAAFRQHTTQAVLLDQHRDTLALYEGQEHYLLVAARGPQWPADDHSLFQGVIED